MRSEHPWSSIVSLSGRRTPCSSESSSPSTAVPASASGFKAALDLAVDQEATLAAVHVVDDSDAAQQF
jgi:hypothetical protein